MVAGTNHRKVSSSAPEAMLLEQLVVWCCFAEICLAFPEKGVILMGEHVFLYNLSIPFSIHGAFPDVQAARSKATDAPERQRCRL